MKVKIIPLGLVHACLFICVQAVTTESLVPGPPVFVGCPVLNCPRLVCSDGYEADSQGCPTCSCRINNCPPIDCDYIFGACPNGPQLDDKGCPRCDCSQPTSTCPPFRCPVCFSTPRVQRVQNGCVQCTCQAVSTRLVSAARSSLSIQSVGAGVSAISAITCTDLQCVFECRLPAESRMCGNCGTFCGGATV